MLSSFFSVTKMYTLSFCIPPTTRTCIAVFIHLSLIYQRRLWALTTYRTGQASGYCSRPFGHWNLWIDWNIRVDFIMSVIDPLSSSEPRVNRCSREPECRYQYQLSGVYTWTVNEWFMMDWYFPVWFIVRPAPRPVVHRLLMLAVIVLHFGPSTCGEL